MTRLKRLNLLLLFSLLLFSACKKDHISDEEIIIHPDPVVIVNASVYGQVLNSSGSPLPNASVRISTEEVFTDQNGVFIFNDVEMKESGELIRAEKDGYFYNAKFVRPQLNKKSIVKLQLIQKTLSGSFTAASGGSISTNGNAKVTFPANAIKTQSGDPYNGNVNVYATWLDPTAQSTLLTMPGDLRGTNQEDQQVQLTTYGMMGVELRDDAGQLLNIANGNTATLEMPVPDDLLTNAPATIPLWYMDEASGYWVEEGTATLQDGKYVGFVSHFSFWNCDVPEDFIDLTGTVMSEGGPVA
ncbi:MAG TPA: carboxypeptidase regulatory-like domain-containing protein, partial [Phaeodactylibacter sp.]|nr:carboxypeptidase regulatory-like domain-containing protein [Phaeodactylibacter sp.]